MNETATPNSEYFSLARQDVDFVIFDLWKTLVPLTEATKRSAFVSIASALGMKAEALRPHWEDTRTQRETTVLRSYLIQLGKDIGHPWSDFEISGAIEVRRAHHNQGFHSPLADALACLRAAREAGMKVAVISNGSSDVAGMLEASPLSQFIDYSVVSAIFGKMKPDRAIYDDVADALSLPLGRSLYVGDGQDLELEGAQAAGCRAVLVHRGSETSWDGESIPDLDYLTKLFSLSFEEREHV